VKPQFGVPDAALRQLQFRRGLVCHQFADHFGQLADAGDQMDRADRRWGRAVIKIGKLPVNLSLSAYHNVVKPQFGADWQLRSQVTLIF
jgi:hypothetical protein